MGKNPQKFITFVSNGLQAVAVYKIASTIFVDCFIVFLIVSSVIMLVRFRVNPPRAGTDQVVTQHHVEVLGQSFPWVFARTLLANLSTLKNSGELWEQPTLN